MTKFANYFFASETNNYHPKVMSPKAIAFVALSLLLLRGLLGTLPAQSAAVDSITIMGLINFERTQRNLPALFTHQSLINAAQIKSQDMIDRDYFAHVNPEGSYIWSAIISAGYSPYQILGENLAISFSTSEGMVKAWIDSPAHRENLLHSDFEHQGLSALFGDYQGGYTNLTTSLFGTLAFGASPPPEPAALPPPAPPQPEPAPQSEPPPIPPPPEPAPEPEPEPTPQPEPIPEPEPALDPTPQPNPGFLDPRASLGGTQDDATQISISTERVIKIVFTVFGVGFLSVLGIDSFIIYRHEKKIRRGHSSYHLFIFILLVLISLLVWFWN